ncbi:MAG: adenylate kinase family protein [Methanomassiliicoccales archaeon]|nr:adenylate kinase family protein [Methanomassiliicoccales archaeon]
MTGTPGTGKSTVATILRSQGWKTLEINDLAKNHGLLKSKDMARDSYELDMDDLQQALEREGFTDGVLVGHLAHLLEVDTIIVLRCHPSRLAERLTGRNWPLAKVRENALAEALDIILAEAMDAEVPVAEVDTTDLSEEDSLLAVLEILAGEKEKYAVGNIDWSEEALRWS